MVHLTATMNEVAFDPARAFYAGVDWIADIAIREKTPGLVIGISGTDSILTFLMAAKAFEQLERPDRVIGIHYGAVWPPKDMNEERREKVLSFTPSYRWVPRVIMPWLQEQAPKAILKVDCSIDYNNDYMRWAALFQESLGGVERREEMPEGGHYWVAGTRNASEYALGTYSALSAGASLQPIQNLWKSDVLKICAWLNVPNVALKQSRLVDCDCGRFDLAADHIDEIDAILQSRTGRISQEASNIPDELRGRLEAFIDEQQRYAGFKKRIPYAPPGP